MALIGKSRSLYILLLCAEFQACIVNRQRDNPTTYYKSIQLLSSRDDGRNYYVKYMLQLITRYAYAFVHLSRKITQYLTLHILLKPYLPKQYHTSNKAFSS